MPPARRFASVTGRKSSKSSTAPVPAIMVSARSSTRLSPVTCFWKNEVATKRRKNPRKSPHCNHHASGGFTMKQNAVFVLILALSLAQLASAQSRAAEGSIAAPQVLPGNGLAQHDFLYAGESKNRRAFIVRKGRVVWSYDDPASRGEISDAVLLSNGNLLLAHQFAVKLISPEKKVLWNLDAPKGSEIHTAMPIGTDYVLYVQNGDPSTVQL